MRSGLSTIQQTLTSEASSVLNQAIAEAARRNHCQTTPLHVAATLLACTSGYLRQACIRSHPNSSHPLQCRALELCFSVALERLPSAAPSGPAASNPQGIVEPPISNALMAALKRAQAHQRRGCPEQQQQPLLAVKVELEQLIISILDDPSVSRVMREASFSSPAVKATIEQSLTSSSCSSSPSSANPTSNFPSVGEVGCGGGLLAGLGFCKSASPLLPANRNLYLNPRFQQHLKQGSVGGGGGGEGDCSGQQRTEEVKKLLDILMRTKKRNPVLVGDSEPEAVMRVLLKRIENKELGDGLLRNVQVIALEKEFGLDRSQIPSKLKELGHLIEARSKIDCNDGGGGEGGGGVILNIGDLKWLVDGPNLLGASPDSGPIQQQQIVSEMGRVAVAEMSKVLARFGEGGSGRVWLIGTATCATYLRCQVYHPSMENDWDLQAVPIAPRTLPTMLPRIKVNGILSSSVESLAAPKCFPALGGSNLRSRCPSENTDTSQRAAMCPVCMDNYERELAKLVAKEFEKSSSESKPEPRQPLPQWLQVAKLSNGAKPATEQVQSKEQELIWKQKTEELLKRWKETCYGIHPNFQQTVLRSNRPALNAALSLSHTHNSKKLLLSQQFQSKLPPSQNFWPLQGNNLQIPIVNTSEIPVSPPKSPVRTDLVLGRPKIPENALEKIHKERIGDSAGCKPDRFSALQGDRFADNLDVDSFKRLFTGLTEKVGWQPEAASAVASTVIQCKAGDGKRRRAGLKGDSWLLFLGPDKVGKKKMASALSELVFGTHPIIITLGGTCADGEDMEGNPSSRGKTTLDRIAEAVRRNPFSVVVLEDVDQADMLVRGSIKRATEKGRLSNSQGFEVNLGSVIFILTANTLPENLKSSLSTIILCEERPAPAVNCGWQLELSIEEKIGKRRADWVCPEGRLTKPRKEPVAGFSFDLNLAAGTDVETGEGSRNSSDVTIEHEQDYGRLAISRPSPLDKEIVDWVDEAIVFKPVDFKPLRRKVTDAIVRKFNVIVGEGGPLLQIDDEALNLIVDGIWFGSATAGFEDWIERVLAPSFQHLKSNLKVEDETIVRLVPVKNGFNIQRSGRGEWLLPGKVTIAVNGLLVA